MPTSPTNTEFAPDPVRSVTGVLAAVLLTTKASAPGPRFTLTASPPAEYVPAVGPSTAPVGTATAVLVTATDAAARSAPSSMVRDVAPSALPTLTAPPIPARVPFPTVT